jgi:hypothetical protein
MSKITLREYNESVHLFPTAEVSQGSILWISISAENVLCKLLRPTFGQISIHIQQRQINLRIMDNDLVFLDIWK